MLQEPRGLLLPALTDPQVTTVTVALMEETLRVPEGWEHAKYTLALFPSPKFETTSKEIHLSLPPVLGAGVSMETMSPDDAEHLVPLLEHLLLYLLKVNNEHASLGRKKERLQGGDRRELVP